MASNLAGYGLSAALLLLMVVWLHLGGRPVWCALVFAVGRAGISLVTGGTMPTAVGTLVVAFALGCLYFWLLDRSEGRLWWWLVLVAGGVVLVL